MRSQDVFILPNTYLRDLIDHTPLAHLYACLLAGAIERRMNIRPQHSSTRDIPRQSTVRLSTRRVLSIDSRVDNRVLTRSAHTKDPVHLDHLGSWAGTPNNTDNSSSCAVATYTDILSALSSTQFLILMATCRPERESKEIRCMRYKVFDRILRLFLGLSDFIALTSFSAPPYILSCWNPHLSPVHLDISRP